MMQASNRITWHMLDSKVSLSNLKRRINTQCDELELFLEIAADGFFDTLFGNPPVRRIPYHLVIIIGNNDLWRFMLDIEFSGNFLGTAPVRDDIDQLKINGMCIIFQKNIHFGFGCCTNGTASGMFKINIHFFLLLYQIINDR